MKTTIQTFCEAFSTELEPFGDELTRALAKLPQREGMREIEVPRRGLQEVQQRLSTLREKVSNQRTFLLIFGPLKSGKSTLMNALSGAYVSEVSSLPAYPALVYVRHGEQRRFEATDYEGSSREFSDNLTLAQAVQDDHARLADAIVAAENIGEYFEPQKHYPKAIRRMDIEVPAVHLAESGSVLVDTPGLYSRMKFGYDQMTRDFRDTAACAIFVVKTDNLFFEKVFEEFEELLSCFSRIFLVPNIDSSKKDLRPDGTLEPSLESRDPGQIIEAFRNLSMSATLRGAIEDGRLRIYPIDLLKAASRTLSAAAGSAPDAEDSAAAAAGDGFDEFVSDLTGYLNSSDYLNDFMVDSLRLARDLTEEASLLASGDAAADLRRGNQQAMEKRDADRARLTAVEKLAQEDWAGAFDALRAHKDELLGELLEPGAEQLEGACQEQLSEWMQSDESWNELLEQRLNPLLAREAARQKETLRDRLRVHMKGPHAGAEFSEAQLAGFLDAGLRVEDVLGASGDVTAPGPGADAAAPRLALEPDDIPIARSVGDLLFLRGRTRVRMEIFGDSGNRAIEASVKERRLAGEGAEKVRAALHDTIQREIPELQRRYADELVEAHVNQRADALRRSITDRKAALEKSIAGTEATLQLQQQAQDVFDTIQNSSLRFDGELSQLQEQFDLA